MVTGDGAGSGLSITHITQLATAEKRRLPHASLGSNAVILYASSSTAAVCAAPGVEALHLDRDASC